MVQKIQKNLQHAQNSINIFHLFHSCKCVPIDLFCILFCICFNVFCIYFLCVFFSADEGTSKTFTCARPLVGQFVAIQLVGVEGSLSLCEVEVFSNDG